MVTTVTKIPSVLHEMEAIRDPKVESLFHKLGAKFEFIPDLAVVKVDTARGLQNQPRLGPALDDETLRKYTEDVYNGVRFPPITVHKLASTSSRSKFTHAPVDGNHRLAAYQAAGEPTIPAYVVDAPPATLSLIASVINTLNGLPTNEASRMHHAEFALNSGASPEQVAALYGLKPSAVRRLQNLRKGSQRAADAGIPSDEWLALNSDVRHTLGTVNTDEGMRKLFEFYRKTYIHTRQLKEIVAQVNETKSAAGQVTLINNLYPSFAEEMTDVALRGPASPGKKRVSAPPHRYRLAFGQIAAIQTAYPSLGWLDGIPAGVRDDLRKQAEAARTWLDEFIAAATKG